MENSNSTNLGILSLTTGTKKWVKSVKIALDLSPILAGNYSGASCVSYRESTECISWKKHEALISVLYFKSGRPPN